MNTTYPVKCRMNGIFLSGEKEEMDFMRNSERIRRKKIIKNGLRHILLIILATVAILSAFFIQVNASGTDTVITPLNSLKTLVIAIIGAVGVIILAKNVMEFAQAYQQQDSSTMNSALKGIVAGIMMAGISAVLGFLGF